MTGNSFLFSDFRSAGLSSQLIVTLVMKCVMKTRCIDRTVDVSPACFISAVVINVHLKSRSLKQNNFIYDRFAKYIHTICSLVISVRRNDSTLRLDRHKYPQPCSLHHILVLWEGL